MSAPLTPADAVRQAIDARIKRSSKNAGAALCLLRLDIGEILRGAVWRPLTHQANMASEAPDSPAFRAAIKAAARVLDTWAVERMRRLIDRHDAKMAQADTSDHKLAILANDGDVAMSLLRILAAPDFDPRNATPEQGFEVLRGYLDGIYDGPWPAETSPPYRHGRRNGATDRASGVDPEMRAAVWHLADRQLRAATNEEPTT